MGTLRWIMWSWTSRRCWSLGRRPPSPAIAALPSSRRWPAQGAGVCAHATSSLRHCYVEDEDLQAFCLFFSTGPQTTTHYQQRVVSIPLIVFVITVYMWVILQQFDVDGQLQMTVRSGPVMMMNPSLLPLTQRIHSHYQCKSVLAWISVDELLSFDSYDALRSWISQRLITCLVRVFSCAEATPGHCQCQTWVRKSTSKQKVCVVSSVSYLDRGVLIQQKRDTADIRLFLSCQIIWSLSLSYHLRQRFFKGCFLRRWNSYSSYLMESSLSQICTDRPSVTYGHLNICLETIDNNNSLTTIHTWANLALAALVKFCLINDPQMMTLKLRAHTCP